MTTLTNQTAIVTGASRGLGYAIAESLAKQGCNLQLISRAQAPIDAVAKELGDKYGVKAKGWAVDMGNSAAVTAAFKDIAADSETIDILVNNAGITKDNLLMRMKDEEFTDVINVNLNSVFYASRAVMRPMMKQKYGRIINISSIVGVRGQAGQSNYSASKSGIIGFTKSLAKEVASRGITCNAIAPGFIISDMTNVLTEEQKAEILKQIPCGRLGEAWEIGEIVVYLASKNAGYLTGQVLSIDGGMGI